MLIPSDAGLTSSILPYDVRYALRYREGQLRVEEIRALAENGFENEAVYMLLKLYAPHLFLQHELLKELVARIAHVPGNEHVTDAQTKLVLKQFVLEHARGAHWSVDGTKLAQISRQGFALWDERYHDIARCCAVDSRDTYIIAHATFIGLAAFLQAHRRTGKELRIIIPKHAMNKLLGYCGYAVNDTVELLHSDFPRLREAFILDDTMRTGTCQRVVSTFWAAGGGEVPPFEFMAVVNDRATRC